MGTYIVIQGIVMEAGNWEGYIYVAILQWCSTECYICQHVVWSCVIFEQTDRCTALQCCMVAVVLNKTICWTTLLRKFYSCVAGRVKALQLHVGINIYAICLFQIIIS